MIVCVVGPTGVGKTKMSIELAKKMNGIVINADAVQIYEGLNIGSAKVLESGHVIPTCPFFLNNAIYS